LPRAARNEAEASYRQLTGARDQLHAHPLILANPAVERSKTLEAEAEKRVAALAGRYGPEHARMVQAQRELAQARDNTRRSMEAVVASFSKEYENAAANEKAVQRSLAGARGSVQNLNRREFRLEALERDVSTNRQIYERFLNRYKETSAAPDAQSTVARVVDPAIAPGAAFKPPKQRIVQAAFLLGLLLGVLAAVMAERINNTIKSGEEVEEKLGLPTVAVLPLLRSRAARSAGRHYLEEPGSIFAEAIRSARTSILLSALDSPRKVLLVTSSLPSEGKSAVAINLALAHAQTRKTLLLEGDLRRPSISAHLGLDPSKPGLTDLLAGSARFNECVQQVGESSLYVLPCGPAAVNPLELIQSERFKVLLERLAAACDVVIVDSPPVHLVSDSIILSRLATGVLFVVKAESTPYPVARRAIHALQSASAPMLGVVLNQLDFSTADDYQSVYAGYVKNYGYTKPPLAS
jgi:polysaccharide biosynthesis transport protein